MLNLRETRQHLRESDFENLFTQELGWDYHTQTLNITIDDTDYLLTAIAEKRGMVVFECSVSAEGFPPDKGGRGVMKKEFPSDKGQGELFVKTPGGKQKLLGPQVTEFILSRFQNESETE